MGGEVAPPTAFLRFTVPAHPGTDLPEQWKTTMTPDHDTTTKADPHAHAQDAPPTSASPTLAIAIALAVAAASLG